MTHTAQNSSVEPVLRAEQITKQYPGTTALNRVNFDIYPGKVNVLIGENGAGKSTLMKILTGVEQPTSGRLLLRDESFEVASPRETRRYGIGIIYQELTLFPDLSVSENIFMAREIVSRAGTINHGKQEHITRALMKRLEQPFEPYTPVGDLRIGQQQLVEIARALAEDVSILIMDEPTSALSDNETTVLFRIIDELTRQGVAIVYISHKLDECLQIGDYFTVLRDGRLVAHAPAPDVSLTWIIEKMSGRGTETLFRKRKRQIGAPLLVVANLSLPRPHGCGFLVENVSFTVNAGEIVGVYGLMGAGRTELMECLFGIQPESQGTICLDGENIESRRIDERMKAGLVLIPEDRQLLGIVQNLSVSKNITLASLRRYVRNMVVSGARERQEVQQQIMNLSIKVADYRQPVTTLSGGNQQKVVVAKNLATQPKVLLMDEPTRGIDVSAKSDIFTIMNDFAEHGMGILFVSSELKEVVALADRAIVMARGRQTAMFEGPEITAQHLADASVQTPSETESNEYAA